MPVTVHLGPARIIVPPEPPITPSGSFVWNKADPIPITQGGTYPLANDLTNQTNLAAFYGYKSAYGGLSSRGLTLNRTSGVLTASPSATVGTSTGHKFEAVTERRCQMHSYGPDCPTWYLANFNTWQPWENLGGDWLDKTLQPQGTTNWDTFVVPDNSAVTRTYTFTGTTSGFVMLLERLRSHGNHGIFLRSMTGGTGPHFWSHVHSNTPFRPTLSVTTNVQTYNCPCVSAALIGEPGQTYAPDSGPAEETVVDYIGEHGFLRFDMTAVTGTIQSAVLSLTNAAHATGPYPQQISMNAVHPPLHIRRPAIEVGGVVEGIASTVANDQALASHPSVLLYHDVVSDQSVFDRWLMAAPETPGNAASIPGYSYVTWPEYGLGAIHAVTLNGLPPNNPWQTVIKWRAQSPLKDHAPIRTGFLRYLMRIDPDMTTAAYQRIKISGCEDWNLQPETPNAAGGNWHMIMEMGPPQSHFYAESRPACFPFQTYAYDVTHNASQVLPYNEYMRQGRFAMEGSTEHIHCIEQQYTTNTVSPSVLQDGIYRMWLDGVLVHESFNCYMRIGQEAKIMVLPFIHIFHGGPGPWAGTTWFEIGGICFATEYIGPPKRIA